MLPDKHYVEVQMLVCLGRRFRVAPPSTWTLIAIRVKDKTISYRWWTKTYVSSNLLTNLTLILGFLYEGVPYKHLIFDGDLFIYVLPSHISVVWNYAFLIPTKAGFSTYIYVLISFLKEPQSRRNLEYDPQKLYL